MASADVMQWRFTEISRDTPRARVYMKASDADEMKLSLSCVKDNTTSRTASKVMTDRRDNVNPSSFVK